MAKKKQAAKTGKAPAKEQTAEVQLDIVGLLNEAARLVESGELDKVKALYSDWISSNDQHPHLYAALFNHGCTLLNTGDNAAAEQTFAEALRRKPDFLQASFNRGTALEKLGRMEEALEAWARLTSLSDDAAGESRELLLMGLNHSGRVLEGKKRFEEAERLLMRSLHLDPDQPKVIHHWVHIRQKQCAWPVYLESSGLSRETMLNSTSALAMLDVSDDPATQLSAAKRFVQEHITPGLEPLANPAGYGHKKIRVGYLSSDFCLHPVSMLMVELFERHDRNRVEVYGYCWSRDDGSELRQRVIRALDHHVSIGGLSDEAAAKRIRADEIDVLVDLQGPTAGARPNILARRPAVVQVSYIGFPGTSGMPCIDHVLCDRYVVPEATRPHMTEKPLFLPEVFQVCDTKRAVGPTPSRKDCGLPEAGFVYCAFNNSHKYTPEMFEVWTNILRRVPGSVLWLVADNSSVKPNLVRFCAERGISEDRLVFASRVSPPDYLARYKAADLFLDCFPFNGGTTANDSLWMGLPLLTLSGRVFASRMAGSLLRCLGLEELIVDDLGQYEELAVELGLNPHRLEELRSRLAESKKKSVLFRTEQQARNIEDLFEEACRKAAALEAPVLKQAPVRNEPSPAGHINLYHIAYSPETLLSTPAGYKILDNLGTDRHDWREYWPIRRFLLEEELVDGCYYGFFSPRFQEKTGLDHAQATSFVQAAGPDVDVITFSPQPDMGAFFLNMFEQGELFHPGIIAASEAFLKTVGISVDLAALMMDSRQIVFSNYFVARPKFWREWLTLNEKLFAICEGEDSELRRLLLEGTTYPGAVQIKVFVMERIASLLLTMNPKWKVRPYNTFDCAWSASRLNQFPLEAVLSDALKIAMKENGFHNYFDAFATVRKKLF